LDNRKPSSRFKESPMSHALIIRENLIPDVSRTAGIRFAHERQKEESSGGGGVKKHGEGEINRVTLFPSVAFKNTLN
jgi:hypothetical protein